MFNRSIVILLLVCGVGCLQSTRLFAQPPDTLWTRTYGTDEPDEAFGAVALEDGGFVFAGISGDPLQDEERVYVVRVDSFGDTLWTKRFGEFRSVPGRGGRYWGAYSVCRAADGGFALTGYSEFLGDLSIYVFLLKMNIDGDSLWTRAYMHEGWGSRVVATADGGFAVAGEVWHPNRDMLLMKTDSLGNEEWSRFYGGTSSEATEDMVVCQDGGFALAGATSSFGVDIFDVYLVRTDSLGDTLWTRTYGSTEDEGAFAISSRADGGFILAGYTDSFGMGGPLGTDAYILRIDSRGDTVWTRTYGYAETDEFMYSIVSMQDGGCVVAGSRSAMPYSAMYIFRIDSMGDSIWSSSYGGIWPDYASTIISTNDGGYCAAGKFHTITSPPLFEFYAVRLGPDLQSAEEPFRFIPEEITLAAYPNPFNPSTTISFSLPRSQHATISVYDLTGRKVSTLADEIMNAGEHAVTFDASGLPSGIYFARMTAGSQMKTQKMVLLR
jgi:hypothetical protein